MYQTVLNEASTTGRRFAAYCSTGDQIAGVRERFAAWRAELLAGLNDQPPA
jgi:hypothetical protein